MLWRFNIKYGPSGFHKAKEVDRFGYGRRACEWITTAFDRNGRMDERMKPGRGEVGAVWAEAPMHK